MVTVWWTVLLLNGNYCDSTHQHYDVTQFEYILWRHTMHEWVMNLHYKTWIAQGRFTNMILTPSKQYGVCDKSCKSHVCIHKECQHLADFNSSVYLIYVNTMSQYMVVRAMIWTSCRYDINHIQLNLLRIWCNAVSDDISKMNMWVPLFQ